MKGAPIILGTLLLAGTLLGAAERQGPDLVIFENRGTESRQMAPSGAKGGTK